MTSHLDTPFISGLPFLKNPTLRPLTFTSLSAQGQLALQELDQPCPQQTVAPQILDL